MAEIALTPEIDASPPTTNARSVERIPPRTPAVLLGDMNMLRCLAGSDIPVVVAASSPDEPALRSRHCRQRAIIAPPSQTEEALAGLERLGGNLARPAVLFYGADASLLLVSRHRERLARHYLFRMPPASMIEDLVDKSRFAILAERWQIPIPTTVASTKVSGPDEILARVPLPCVIKPNTHIGWYEHKRLQTAGPQKALRAGSADEVRALYDLVSQHTHDFLVQTYIPGGEEEVHSYHAYLNGSGRVLGEFVGKKIRTFPMHAGRSTYLELIKEPTLVALGREILEKVGFVGPIKIDFKRDPRTGHFYVLELNPRFTLWNYLGARSGVNLPRLAYADLVGEPVMFAGNWDTKTRWLSFGNDVRTFLRGYRPSGALGAGAWLRSLRGRKIYDVFSWDDPLPWAASSLNYVRAVGARLWQALRP